MLCCPRCKEHGFWLDGMDDPASERGAEANDVVRCNCGWRGRKRKLVDLGWDKKPLPVQIPGQTTVYDYL